MALIGVLNAGVREIRSIAALNARRWGVVGVLRGHVTGDDAGRDVDGAGELRGPVEWE